MGELEILEVRLSRFSTVILGSVALLFILAGFDIAYFKTILDFTIDPEKKWIFYAFLFFAVGIGSVILIQMIHYFLFPPLMLRVAPEGITFAIGFRYNPFLIPGPYVKWVGRGITVDLTSKVDFFDVVCIDFEESPDIPSWQATSIGVKYFQYRLTLEWFFRNTSSGKIIEVVNSYMNSRIWGVKGFLGSKTNQSIPKLAEGKKIPLP